MSLFPEDAENGVVRCCTDTAAPLVLPGSGVKAPSVQRSWFRSLKEDPMSAPLSRVYPERVELARRTPLLTVVPAVIVVSLLGIAGVGFAWSSAVRTKHAVTENYKHKIEYAKSRSPSSTPAG